MEYTIQQAKDEVARFVKMSWDHEYAEHGMLSKSDAIQFAELYASKLRESDRKRIEELEGLLQRSTGFFKHNEHAWRDQDFYVYCDIKKALNL